VELAVRAFMDDVASPDLTFETDDGLCADIGAEIERFIEEIEQ
jgi:hypothetical protein